jgi:hypothetical protein
MTLAGKRLRSSLAVIGLVTLIVLLTPIISRWARLYSGAITHPKGDVLILPGAAADDDGDVSYSSY